MGSMKALAQSNRLVALGATSVLALILAGYLALTASAFWAFTKTSAPAEDSIDDGANDQAGLVICRCYPEAERESADN